MASHRQMRNKWITIIRNLRNDQKWEPAIDSRICSRHFLKEKFYMAGNRRRLIGQSAPTLFLRGATTGNTFTWYLALSLLSSWKKKSKF